MRFARLVVVLALVHAYGAPANAELASRLEPRSLVAQRAAGEIRLDGVLDEPAWANAAEADGFIQQEPAPGADARLATRFRVVFDDKALYAAIRLDDPGAARPARRREQLGLVLSRDR